MPSYLQRLASTFSFSQKPARSANMTDSTPVPYQPRFRERFSLATVSELDARIVPEINERKVIEPLQAYPKKPMSHRWRDITTKVSAAVSFAKEHLTPQPDIQEIPVVERVVTQRTETDLNQEQPRMRRAKTDLNKELPPTPMRQDSGYESRHQYNSVDLHLGTGRDPYEAEIDVYAPQWQHWRGKGPVAESESPYIQPAQQMVYMSHSLYPSSMALPEDPLLSDRMNGSRVDPYSHAEQPVWWVDNHYEPHYLNVGGDSMQATYQVSSALQYAGYDVDDEDSNADSISDTDTIAPLQRIVPLKERSADWLSDKEEDSQAPELTYSNTSPSSSELTATMHSEDCRFCDSDDECPLLFAGEDQACLARFAHNWMNRDIVIDQEQFQDFDGAYGEDPRSYSATPKPPLPPRNPRRLDYREEMRRIAAAQLEGAHGQANDGLAALQSHKQLGQKTPRPARKPSHRKLETPLNTPVKRISGYFRPPFGHVEPTEEEWLRTPAFAYLGSRISRS